MLLNFEKPKKVLSTKEHNKRNTSDCGVEGTYVPNMSKEDNCRWKCKHIKGKHERIEIRRFVGGVNLVIIVWKKAYHGKLERPEYKFNMSDDERVIYEKSEKEYRKDRNMIHPEIKISMNGSAMLRFEDWKEINQIANEAKEYLEGDSI